jgi:hypothetical protein
MDYSFKLKDTVSFPGYIVEKYLKELSELLGIPVTVANPDLDNWKTWDTSSVVLENKDLTSRRKEEEKSFLVSIPEK